MTRDMDLVRKLLMYFDAKPNPGHIEKPEIDGYDDSTVQNHLILLFDAGLLRAEPVRSSTSDRIIKVIPFDLTWQGHEFLAKIREEGIWRRVKATIGEKGIPMSIEMVSTVATKIATSMLGD
jgi:DNA-binding transcriptional ArsR family regulator